MSTFLLKFQRQEESPRSLYKIKTCDIYFLIFYIYIYVSRPLQDVFGTDVFLSLQRMDTTLSNMKEKINNAQCALPLFTCLHVKPDVSELMFAGVFLIC